MKAQEIITVKEAKMFQAKEQEFFDRNTGVTIRLGEHAGIYKMHIVTTQPNAGCKSTMAHFNAMGELFRLVEYNGTAPTARAAFADDPADFTTTIDP
jgi:hypothetical protein